MMKEKKLQRLSSEKWQGMGNKEMREKLRAIYEVFIGKTVINRETKTPITITFNQVGRKHTLLFLKEDKERKATIVEHLLVLLRHAELVEVRMPKESKKHFVKKVFVYLIHCEIDKREVKYAVIVRKTIDGVFQYDLYENNLTEKGAF